jgi:hypothetical protein
MKRTLLSACALGLTLALGVNASQPTAAVAPSFAYYHGAQGTATDDPLPVDCPFCGGDPILHARTVNAIAFFSARVAFRVLDESLF